jgi:hypothetical protein
LATRRKRRSRGPFAGFALADPPPLEQLNDQNDDRDNEQDVDETAECVA